MNAQVEGPTEGQSPAPATAEPAKKKAEVEKVTMSDGRVVEFAGAKTRVLKEALVRVGDQVKAIDALTEEELNSVHVGNIFIRMDFRNGTFRDYSINTKLGLRFAAHGALQKYGDQLAGEDAPDLDDWAASTDKLHERLSAGEWSKSREGGSMAGTSVLLQALVEFSGRTMEEVKAMAKDWSQQERQAMRLDPDIKPIIERIEQEKAARNAKNVNTGALKDKLKALAA